MTDFRISARAFILRRDFLENFDGGGFCEKLLINGVTGSGGFYLRSIIFGGNWEKRLSLKRIERFLVQAFSDSREF